MPTLATQIDNSVRVEELIREALDNVRKRMEDAMKQKGRNASGRSVASLSITTNSVSGVLKGYGSWLAMETGRKGGKVPSGFANIIAQWIVDKGISIEPNKLPSVAYLISRKIARHGTSLYRRGGFDDIYSTASQEEVEKLNNKILTMLGSDISYLNAQFAKP